MSAMLEVDRVARQNSSDSKELNATARELRRQAVGLVDLVAAFEGKSGNGNGHTHASQLSAAELTPRAPAPSNDVTPLPGTGTDDGFVPFQPGDR